MLRLLANRMGKLAFMAVIVIAVMMLAACGQPQADEPESGLSAENPSAGTPAADNPSAEVSSPEASSAASVAATVLPASLDLANAADRALVNERLSWMSQAFHDEASGDVDVSSANAQVRFAVHYLGLTDRGTWETGDFTEIAGPGYAADGSTNARVATRNIDVVAGDFFGTAPDYGRLSGTYKHIDGYVYFSVTAPPGQSAGYSAATGLEPLGDGRYAIDFEVYSSDMPYMEQGDAFYSSTPQKMMAALGKSAPWHTGHAIVRVEERGGAPVVVLESYELDPLGAEGSESAAAPAESAEPAQRDMITGRFYGLGADAPNGLESVTFGDGEVVIVGELWNSDGGGSMGSKEWVFAIDESTRYGFSVYDGFHEQSLGEVADNWAIARFVGIGITVEDGLVTLMGTSA